MFPMLIYAGHVELGAAIRESIRGLTKHSGFSFVDLRLADWELEAVARLTCDRLSPGTSAQYDCFGSLHLIQDELPAFLMRLGNNDDLTAATVARIISKITQCVVTASNRNSAWLCVRAFAPTADFDTPRWHIDGTYYGPIPSLRPVFKFAATLKAASTRLYRLPDDHRDHFLGHAQDRSFRSEWLEADKSECATIGEGVFFIVANEREGAIHSEPQIHEERLFFSILIGDEPEIEELYSSWHPGNASSVDSN